MVFSSQNRVTSLLRARQTRRDALRYTGLGLGAVGGAVAFGQAAGAQDATPAAETEETHLGLPQGERTFTMFVQTARAGTWSAKEGEEGVYTLTLTGLPAQTVYFSDRPQRIVGTQSTAEFLDALGFVPDNPPNAALVTQAEDGADDILVIELFNPAYTEDQDGATLVYEARILQNYHETRMGAVAMEQDDTAIPASFDGASLFIDDCADGIMRCTRAGRTIDYRNYGCCYKFPGCNQCHSTQGICNTVYGCEDGGCTAIRTKECYLF